MLMLNYKDQKNVYKLEIFLIICICIRVFGYFLDCGLGGLFLFCECVLKDLVKNIEKIFIKKDKNKELSK